jgi:catechol 2,3-dioxygenase-like lactoylglutathione lyase family enzyme
MSNFLQITPFMYVTDLASALKFFTDTLAFKVDFHEANYAYIEREQCAIRILEEKDPACGAPPGNRRYAYYIDVKDVDGLHAELKPKLDLLPPKDVLGPINQPYGQRELLVLAPDGNLIVFGQSIKQ